jgi:hypothetical protein
MPDRKLGPEFTYDLSEFLKVDPALIHYDEKAAVATGLRQPRGIAVDARDRLWVAGDQTVRCLAADGRAESEFKTAGEPQRIAVGPAGTIYLAMADHVEVYDSQGKRQAAWPSVGPRSLLTCVAASDADVFVADAGGPVVLRYDAAGRLAGRIGEEDAGRGIPGIIVPSPYFDVAIGTGGLVWVADPGRRRVECYTFGGDLRSSWGRASPKIEGFCGCCNPTHIAILPGGGFVTSEKGLPRVKTYTAAGEFQGVVAPPSAFDAGAVGLDVAADSKGRILVLDPLARSVRVFVKKVAAGPAEAKS